MSVTVTRRGHGPALIRPSQARVRRRAGAKGLWVLLALAIAALVAVPAIF